MSSSNTTDTIVKGSIFEDRGEEDSYPDPDTLPLPTYLVKPLDVYWIYY
jgi:hypothetical protein